MTSSSMKIGDLRPRGAACFAKRSVSFTSMVLPSLPNRPFSQGGSRADSKMLSAIFCMCHCAPVLKSTVPLPAQRRHFDWATTCIFESFSSVWQRLRIGTHSYKKISSGRHMATQPIINMPSATISEAAPVPKENPPGLFFIPLTQIKTAWANVSY